MKFPGGPPSLLSERLALQAFAPGDAQAIFAAYASDPQATKYMAFPTHRSVADAADFLARLPAALASGEQIVWAIRPRGDDALIGSIGLMLRDSRCEVGYILGRSYWGQGIVPEAVRAVLDFARDVLRVPRVYGRCDVENRNSARVFEKCGFRRTGTSPRSSVHPNLSPEPRDVYTFEYEFA